MFKPFRIAAALAALISLNLTAPRAAVANPTYSGSIGIQTPFGQTPGHASENTPQVLWNLKLSNVVEKFSLFTVGEFGTTRSNIYDVDNKFLVGVQHPLFSNVDMFVAYERRYSVDQNRYLVGFRYNFCGKL